MWYTAFSYSIRNGRVMNQVYHRDTKSKDLTLYNLTLYNPN